MFSPLNVFWVTRLVSGAVKGAHGFAGLGVVWCTQLHGTVQIQLQRFRCEAKHLKAVANGGTFSVAAELSGVVVVKGNRVVVCAPGRTRGKRKMLSASGAKIEPRGRAVLTRSGAGRDRSPLWRLAVASAWPNTY